MRSFEEEVNETQEWFDSPRFAGVVRLYTARQVAEQRGTISHDYTIAREAAAAFYDRLRQLFAVRKSITTFGPYSPGQGVAMKRSGPEYQAFLDRAFAAMFDQSESFRKALMATGQAVITHSLGKNKAADTVLTEREFCSRLMKLRNGAR